MPPANSNSGNSNSNKEAQARAQLNAIWEQLGKAGGQKAHEEHKAKPANYGNPQLPSGIEGGIAKLILLKLGVYDKGDYKGKLFFMAQGIAVFPEEHNGFPVKGGRTQIGPIPLCETKKDLNGNTKSFSHQYSLMLNQLKLLTSESDVAKLRWQDIPAFMEALLKKSKSTGVYFKFRTWGGGIQTEGPYKGKQSRINHEWNGRCEYSKDKTKESAKAATEDDTTKSQNISREKISDSSASQNQDTKSLTSDQVIALGERASNGDDNALSRLLTIAEQEGFSNDDLELFPSWKDVAEAIVTGEGVPDKFLHPHNENGEGSDNANSEESTFSEFPSEPSEPEEGSSGEGESDNSQDESSSVGNKEEQSGDEEKNSTVEELEPDQEEEAEEEEEKKPSLVIEKGKTCLYRPITNGRQSKNVIHCEITAVNQDKRTVVLKNLTTGGKIPSVPFDKLLPEEG